MKANIGIDEHKIKKISEILSGILSNAYVLLVKTKNYHWNVIGPDFSELHKLFDEQYEQISGNVDEIAERIRSLGAVAPGTLAEFLKQTSLKEKPGERPSAGHMIGNLLADHETVIRELRQAVNDTAGLGDAGTSDFLTGLMEEHEKTAWMLRAYLEK